MLAVVGPREPRQGGERFARRRNPDEPLAQSGKRVELLRRCGVRAAHEPAQPPRGRRRRAFEDKRVDRARDETFRQIERREDESARLRARDEPVERLPALRVPGKVALRDEDQLDQPRLRGAVVVP